ncbi:unnamed protein product [Cylindrotheca closterium]|uniref:Uncharacterized protein n=1 Tax=Cylindrotheca closterium TaxID=2856 RepID=A0AAD2JPF3_9STRA|nr:unnamed protein product [Cylindrotheca closterium]
MAGPQEESIAAESPQSQLPQQQEQESLSTPNTDTIVKEELNQLNDDLLQTPQELNDSASDVTSSVSSTASSSDAILTPQAMRRPSNFEMDQFNIIFHKTLKEVEKIARLRVGDTVITPFGEGKLLELGESNKIALPWGILCTRLQNIHRKLPELEFQEAMDHLNEVRKLHFAVECQKLNIPLQIDGCTACLLERPEYKVKRNQNQSRWNRFKQRVDESRKNKKQHLWVCDVCGNPVCKFHDRQQQKGGGDHFHMCVDCSYDLNQVEHQLNPYHPNVLQSLERLLLLYTRMCLQLSFWMPYVPELCSQIFQKQRKNAKISLANTSLGFVGAALGVASAATMLTPAGPAILIAAMATSATSGTLQATHQGYDKYFSSKVTHEISDRLIAWQGLCCGILQSLEQLRRDLLAERQHFSASATFGHFSIKNNKKEADVWSTLAVGSMGVTRSAFTGVGVTASMGAGYAQVINSGLQTIPLVGAAFSVTYMAMDAGNIYSHLQQLSTPNSYIIRLKQLQNAQTNGGLPHVSTVETEVDMLDKAIRDINSKIKLLREEQDSTPSQVEEESDKVKPAQDDSEAAATVVEAGPIPTLLTVQEGALEGTATAPMEDAGEEAASLDGEMTSDDEPNNEL